MPPASKAVSTSSKPKTNHFSTSPDSESTQPEPEVQTVSSKKKKKKNAASKQAQNSNNNDRASNLEVTRVGSPSPARPQTILSQIPHGFPASARKDSLLLDIQDVDVAVTEKVSDQYTPPNDPWFDDGLYGKSPPVEQKAKIGYSASPPVEPGFSTRARYDSKSPPISPPVRHVRPVSYGGGIPPIPALPRASPSAYSYAPSAYGSPPAPHLPQQHFYHAQDVHLGLPRTSMPYSKEEPTLMRYTRLSSVYSSSRQGILLGFEGRLNILSLEGGGVDELGVLEGLSGTVVDAAILERSVGSEAFAAVRPLVAVVVHGPKELQGADRAEGMKLDARPSTYQQMGPQGVEYATRVEVFSMSTQERLAVLLETPAQMTQGSFRGASPTPPNPIGHLRLQASGAFLIVTSGVSGEVYAFTVTKDSIPAFECIGKFWSAIQPQIQRRDSSHHQTSDADISPADVGRAARSTERAISSTNGRWLAISPVNSPSRPSLGALMGPQVRYGRHAGVETTSPPVRPSVTCEVDSPDVDTLFGKVARGVAQELVKGARWLGDQGYQTWQSYWKKEQSPSLSATQAPYSPLVHPTAYTANAFPPTHGEVSHNSKEPELISVYDLQSIHDSTTRKGSDELKPLATFQPPKGCSFLSFAPHGLNLLTAGRKGDVQYVWDLMQIKNCRSQILSLEEDRIRAQPRVRQIAKYERLSGSTIVDVVWDMPTGARFAVLTKNKTIHLFDLPFSAFRWPPPRSARTSRPSSRSIDSTQHDPPVSSGFFASAMNIANQAQPIITNWRGRAPSMGAGLAGIGQTGIGLASATGAKGGKVVVAGLSKSLGAASETVNQIRHAGENRLHMKSNKDPLPGKIFWIQRGIKCAVGILEVDSIKQYQVRRNTNQERRDKDNATVFAARKAIVSKLPSLSRSDSESSASYGLPNMHDRADEKVLSGFWKVKSITVPMKQPLTHPLSFAEIETNAPYQPFHSDRRVTLSIYSDANSETDAQLAMISSVVSTQPRTRNTKSTKAAKGSNQWVFGNDVPAVVLNISKVQIRDDENDYTGSVIYRETVKLSSPTARDDDMDQIVSTTRRRKVKKSQNTNGDTGSDGEKEDGFFEDDCDVLDFATDRV